MLQRVALITNGIWPYSVGGIQKHSFYLCRYLSQLKIYVDVYYTNNYQIEKKAAIAYFDRCELSYINFIFISSPSPKRFPGHYLWESYYYSKNLNKELQKRLSNYDLVYIQGLSGWNFLTSSYAGKKPVTLLNMHGLNMFQNVLDFRSRLEQLLFKSIVLKLLKKSDYIQSLGGRLTDILIKKKINNEKILEIGIGIERHWLADTGLKNNSIRSFVFIGRFDRTKGINELNEALGVLLNAGNFYFHFIGPIPKSYQLNSEKIYYYGEVVDEKKIKNILDKSDFLVLPSYSEGMPTVILEAMARSCAIIATNVGAVSELISEKNGFLIEAHNKSDLLIALNKALSLSSEKLREMQQASKDLVTNKFVWDKLIEKMVLNFKNIILSCK